MHIFKFNFTVSCFCSILIVSLHSGFIIICVSMVYLLLFAASIKVEVILFYTFLISAISNGLDNKVHCELLTSRLKYEIGCHASSPLSQLGFVFSTQHIASPTSDHLCYSSPPRRLLLSIMLYHKVVYLTIFL